MSALPPGGTDTIQISDRDGMCILHFDHPVEWCALDPATAASVAEALARASYKAKFGDVPTTQAKSQITEQLRVRMCKRVELMLQSMAGEIPRVEFKVQAERVTDAVFKEVG
jgi:hypothetical protein